MNKKLIFPIVALAIIGFGIIGTGIVLADENKASQESIVQKIAEKFGLKESEVQKVFDEVRKERLAEMKEEQEKRLTQLVTEGKITEEQKSLIINKQLELQDERESIKNSFKDLTPEERKAQIEKRKTDLEAWAKEKDIDIQYLMHFNGGKHFNSMPDREM